MAYNNSPVKRNDEDGSQRTSPTDYDRDIDNARMARNNQLKDSDPMIEKEGFLGVDDLDKIRRRKLIRPNNIL